jgi:hypothetical protein
VVHGGAPPHALAVCELAGGARCYARCDSPELTAAMEQQEWVGREVNLSCENGVNKISG